MSEDSSCFTGPMDKKEFDEAFKVRSIKNEALRNVQIPQAKSTLASLLNPFSFRNMGIPLSYFDVGIAMNFLGNPVTYYMIDTLNISSTQYSAYANLIALPWSLKFLFGMLSDGVPIFSYRRKSWFALGWIGFVLCNIYLYLTGEPSFSITTIFVFLMTLAYLVADVCCDTITVERARYEYEEIKGTLQTSVYTIRAFGSFLGALLGMVLYNTSSWGWGLTIAQIFLMNGLFPCCGVILGIWLLIEFRSNKAIPTFSEQLSALWETLQLRAVWYPMIFIYLYNVFQIPNSAWSNFLIVGLGFTDFDLGMITVVSNLLYWVGMVIFKQFFFETSWRNIYIYTTIFGQLFSLLQILLILQVNVAIGIPNLAFALGDQAVYNMIYGIQMMPTVIMFAMLCPEGNEAVTYALLTTISNLAALVAGDIGSAMTLIWDVDNATIASGDWSGMLKLTILTSLLQLAPLALVWILPDSKEEQRALRDSGETSFWGGFNLSLTIFLSLVGTIAVNVYFIWFDTDSDDAYTR